MTNFTRRAISAIAKRTPSPAGSEAGLRIAIAAVNVILVILLAHALAGLTAALWFGPAERLMGGMTAPASDLPVRETAGAVTVDHAAIVAWHLFGRAETVRPVDTPPPPLPVTPLNLRLVGVFFIERDHDRALALIAEGSGQERGYRIGELLPGGARLEQVRRDHVVVSRNGRQEVLNLPKLGDPNIKPPPAPSPPAPDPEPSPSAGVLEPPVVDASAVAQRLRGQTAAGPQALEEIAFASPYVQDGRFLGFRLRPGRDQQLLRQLGLHNGDVITEVNGSRLNNPMQGLSALQDVMNANQVNVRVLRNGAEMPLTFSLGYSAPK